MVKDHLCLPTFKMSHTFSKMKHKKNTIKLISECYGILMLFSYALVGKLEIDNLQ